ncbi:MAG: DUF3307 domain-containing protein [Bacilli bacterium]|jgi:hypothetical protein|nr:DUF3307 domain-containing protein [Bacilli bacterium]HHU23758.1 DUF3307 domain-containing protein [Acholeplasmataceae bacterium]
MVFFILFLSHLISDFLWQSREMAERKVKSYKTAILHAFIHFVSTIVILFICYLFTLKSVLFSFPIIATIAIISVFHFLLDTFGKRLLNKLFRNNVFFVFLADQILHFMLLFVFTFLLVPNYRFGNIVDSILVSNIIYKPLFMIILLLTFFMLLTCFTGHLIAKLFITLNHNKNDKESLEEVRVIEKTTNDVTEITTEKIKYPVEVNEYGKWIGYCERIIIFLLFFLQAYEGIAIIVALKTFARYQQLNQKNFVEKYLLGTLFSVMMAILFGILARAIFFIF